MKRHLPLKALQVFLSAAQHESFKLAAEQLFVTQAAVSQQIRALENYFDCQLFDRDNKHTQLNVKGKMLFPYIEEAFNQINQGINALTFEPHSSELKISSLHSITSLLLIPNIADFQDKNTNISVQFSPNNLLDDFKHHDIDVVIRRGLGDYPGLESRKLIDDAIVLIASPLLLATKTSEVNAIFSLPLLEDTSSDIQEAILDCCEMFQIKREQLKSALKTTDALPVVQGALSGQGIAFVSKVLVAKQIQQGSLVNVFNYAFENPKTLYLVAPKHHFSWQKVKKFEAWISRLLSEHQ